MSIAGCPNEEGYATADMESDHLHVPAFWRHKSVLSEECRTTVSSLSHKRVLPECPRKVSPENVLQGSKSVFKESQARVPNNLWQFVFAYLCAVGFLCFILTSFLSYINSRNEALMLRMVLLNKKAPRQLKEMFGVS